eukprot:TRINITY_DN7160_c0_g1_i1.p1 TRINITY_DN7160_c0_g1~~TRINITY_DN7160_c0_g1_i1.p1  ORF type:complete len:278 (+),score=40.37 TRINITY_DN7160_c0_g1_i1:42-875(+)
MGETRVVEDTNEPRLGKFAGAQQALLRQATVSDEEREAIGTSFEDKAVRRMFMKKVYGILSVQLTFTVGCIAFFMFYVGGMGGDGRRFVNENIWLLFTCMGISLLVLFPMVCVRTLRVTFPVNFILLAVFTIAESIMLGMVSTLYDTESVIIAAGVTALIVFFLTIFAFQTKIDFTMCRGVMGCILFVFLICGLIMLFVPYGRTMDIIYGAAGALIFSVYLVIDTQMMMGGHHKFAISPEEYIFAGLFITKLIKYWYTFIFQLLHCIWTSSTFSSIF